ncbi:phage Gp37/Gp68 family protein [Paracoccus sp. MA]|uniref:DUF5131 family protein n=1 Tax=Paracoccus sp. MA TaxID=2895796 RepID=UPI001E47EBED|nr:phage Gp37/Gp68 family protein [Paracoccus sp. MA]UFM64271.1 phage Gp37/Gp68 family protein [Paracoccus sp. MA]
MAENSNIEWTHHTFNPWIGCQKVGPGCDHCYAESWDARGLQQRETRWGPHAARTRTSAANWRKPLSWDRAAAAGERHRVFCASLADVFDNHASILPEWRADLWQLIWDTPHLDWMLLTKRPGNIVKMLPRGWRNGWSNVWLGCTVVNQAEADRDIPKLLEVPATVRFLSMEPLLGPVDLRSWIGSHPYIGTSTYAGLDGLRRCDLSGNTGLLDLVIVGGESGPGARPMHPDWARSLRDQCQAAGVAFHFKQWGEWGPGATRDTPADRAEQVGTLWSVSTVFGGPAYLAIREGDISQLMERFGKKAAGRLLDGRTWDEMPGAHNARS